MDINENLTQVNTFIKGMDTDTSDMYLSNQSYRYAENVRLISNEGDAGELRLIVGTTSFPIENVVQNESRLLQTDVDYTILSLDSIRNLIVFILVDYEGYWFVAKYDIDTEEFSLVTSWLNERIWPIGWDGKTKPITTVLRHESTNNIKLYIADGIHNIMALKVNEDNTGKTFDELFSYQRVLIDKPSVELVSGGILKGGIVQYAYRLYNNYGSATTLSILSDPISLYVDNISGAEYDRSSGKGVKITIPQVESVTLNKMQIFRIHYLQQDMQPKIDIIQDSYIFTSSITDYGYVEKEITIDEFLSYYNLSVMPKVIESKGDYLFAGNIKFYQEEIDKQFENFDARCFSSGMRFKGNNDSTAVFNALKEGLEIDINNLENIQFDQSEGNPPQWKEEYWKCPADISTYDSGGAQLWLHGGIGKCFTWQYTTKQYKLNFTDQANTYTDSHRSYKRGEVYRFGVRLFDKNGYASTVKWIADIMIPDVYSEVNEGTPQQENETTIPYIGNYFAEDDSHSEYNGRYFLVNQIGIQFDPVYDSTDPNSPWKNVYGYEIVQCERKLSDKYCLMQGIAGYPVEAYELLNNVESRTYDELYPNGLMSTSYFNINSTPVSWIQNPDTWANYQTHNNTYDHSYNTVVEQYLINARSYRNLIMFASPEYIYQENKVKDLIDTVGIENLYLKHAYTFSAGYYDHDITGLISTQKFTVYQTINIDNNTTVDLSRGYPYIMGGSINTDVVAYSISDSNNNYLSSKIMKKNGDVIDIINRGNITTLQEYMHHNTIISYNVNNETDTLSYRTYQNEDIYNTVYYLNYFVPISDYSFINENEGVFFRGKPAYSEKVKNIAYIDSPVHNTFNENDNFTYRNASVPVANGKTFINWSVATLDGIIRCYPEHQNKIKDLMSKTGRGQTWTKEMNEYDPRVFSPSITDHQSLEVYALSPISAGGKVMLINVDRIHNDIDSDSVLNITTLNLVKPAIPYGGLNEESILSSRYLSYGNFVKITDEDKQDVLPSIDVFSGDAYIKMFTYNAAHAWSSEVYTKCVKVASIYKVPIESDIDLQGQYSNYVFGQNGFYGFKVQDTPAAMPNFSQSEPSYLYNNAYNTVQNAVSFGSQKLDNEIDVVYDTRVMVSQKKENNEPVDNWGFFKVTDFLDVDSRFGQITAMKLFKDKLMFWQDRAAGVISSNERSIVTDQNSSQIILGSGNVLDRFDYISQIYGMKPEQNACTVSSTDLYWWDGYNKEILQYKTGYEVNPLSSTKNVKSYLSNLQESDTPLMFYDSKYKEVVGNVVNNECIVYNEQAQCFTSIYKFSPVWYTETYDKQIITGGIVTDVLHLYNSNDPSMGVCLFGDYKTYPKIKYVVNNKNTYNKVFDTQLIGGRFYGGSEVLEHNNNDTNKIKGEHTNKPFKDLTFEYKTPLKQSSSATGSDVITNVEYDYKLAIPRSGNKNVGNRMRGKTMECTLSSKSNDLDFSLQYITTKYRLSWT